MVLKMFVDSRVARTAPMSSSLGIVTAFRGATRVFEAIKRGVGGCHRTRRQGKMRRLWRRLKRCVTMTWSDSVGEGGEGFRIELNRFILSSSRSTRRPT